jgi:hypothetical protein
LGVIARQSFSDVVQQHGNIQSRTRCDSVHDIAGKRMLIPQFTALDRREVADSPD